MFKQQAPNINLLKCVEMQVREFMYCVAEPASFKEQSLNAIKWVKPVVNWFKLNTYGSVRDSTKLAGGGGLIRNWEGQWIASFGVPIGLATSIAAEL